MALSNRDRIGRALDLLAPALDAFITTAVADVVPAGSSWTALLAVKDAEKGTGGRTYERGDVQNSLRVITENVPARVKPGWYPFRETLSPSEQALASELRDVRNSWAHQKPFSEDDAYRALDTAERFLRAIGSPQAADEVAGSRKELRRLSAERQDRRVLPRTATVAGEGLKPWREVLLPHPDVASGDFKAAEFAADLYLVSTGRATPEYGDPAQFFGRTFLTDGLGELLGGAVQRITGNRNASPVVNLQTTFGGGKTHSMLSLWHLFSGTPLTDLPQETQELVSDALPDGAEGADAVLPAVRRVAIVGNHLQAGSPSTKPDGTVVYTLWGELAWQLAGAEGYAYVADADRTATNPGEALHRLFAAFGPAVILVDEWVAYARQLVGNDSLRAGTFDTHFSFAQVLTEAAKATPGVLLVISIPASPDADRDGVDGASPVANDEEVGGENGVIALRRLQNVVRRVASQWRAASADEAFEIVRQRLFESPTPDALAQIRATAQQMVEFYRRHSGEFPSAAQENEYVDRIRRSYPVHPELFDRLYEDWSTLDRFQRTRGVLRLMNTLVHALWVSNDTAPLIMPGSLPLAADAVVTELTQYVEDQFKSVISRDVEGPDATPHQVDEANRALLGTRLVTQRLARTIFLGATPTLRTANKGIDRKRVFLGTALPGDVPGNFHSALGQLTERATYLYTSGTSYWFDTQANTSRTARDHAEQLHLDDVINEVDRRLDVQRRNPPAALRGVHLTDDPASVPDSDEVRLVVLPLRHPHEKRAGQESPAAVAARRLVDLRGGGQRLRRNLVVVLAADATRAVELEQSVRDHLGWRYVVEHADTSLNLTAQQKAQAVERQARTEQTLTDRLLDTYTWLLVPEAQPGRPYTLRAVRSEGAGATSVVERAARKLVAESDVATVHAAALIGQQLNGSLAPVWERGHVSIAGLWELYATHPYLPRLRDRRVLEEGALGALDSPWAWQMGGFALADAYDATAERYVGLRLPDDDGGLLGVTGETLLVRLDVAEAQRAAEAPVPAATAAHEHGAETVHHMSRVAATSATSSSTASGTPVTPAPITRFFGSKTLRSDRYGEDFAGVVAEVLQRLSAQPGVDVDVRLEISATSRSGFTDDVVRTVGENATTLRFEQSGFEAE